MDQHARLTQQRVKEYDRLFGGRASAAFPYTLFSKEHKPDEPCIDVFAYTLHQKGEHVYALVTNGMSDTPLPGGGPHRVELIQYVARLDEEYAKQLHTMALLPHRGRFNIDAGDTISRPFPGVFNSRWQHGFFLQPGPQDHRQAMTIDTGNLSFLWFIPISEDELAFKNDHGLDTFLQVLDESELPWVFDETTRISMV